jgi:hypothetical protein
VCVQSEVEYHSSQKAFVCLFWLTIDLPHLDQPNNTMAFQLNVVFLALLNFLQSVSGSSAGILYETWHTYAAQAMQTVLSMNGTGLTAETVLRAGGKLSFNDVYAPL